MRLFITKLTNHNRSNYYKMNLKKKSAINRVGTNTKSLYSSGVRIELINGHTSIGLLRGNNR